MIENTKKKPKLINHSLPPLKNNSKYLGAITSLSKLETERQTSSDILEELRMQGIIKTSCPTTKNRTADDDIMVSVLQN